MPINERDQAILKDLEKAASEDPDLSAYYDLHRTLLQMLAQARAGISATLEIVDEEALQARLLQGLPLLSFAQLPLEAERFATLVSAVARVLAEYDPELAEQTVPDSPAEVLTLARQRFADGQVGEGRALWEGVSNEQRQLGIRGWWYGHIGETERAEWIEQAASDHP